MVSVIIIFLNEENFIREAIESVLAQTYDDWELLLVDDGSTDASSQIARYYSTRDPERIVYLDHKNHQNRGMSASRNLGISHAKGKYVAFLDADDVWLPDKLTKQVAILSSLPEAAMVYGRTKYWFSWSGNVDDNIRDYIQPHKIDSNQLYQPPVLLSYFLQGKAAVPCTCSLMVKLEALKRIGGFEESFTGMYEDQAFYAKICLAEPIFVSDECLDKYRQHSNSNCSIAIETGQSQLDRLTFLKWLAEILSQQHIEDTEIRLALRRELWLCNQSLQPQYSEQLYNPVRWLKKWVLRVEERFLPPFIRRWLWIRN